MPTITKARPPVADIAAGKGTGDEIAAIAKALGHPARIQIVRMLLEKQSCFGCDMVDEVKLAQSTVSEHLRILKSAGIITGEIEHPRVCYSLNPGSLMPFGRTVECRVRQRRSRRTRRVHLLPAAEVRSCATSRS
jgi:ArsR family transcriptional regulator, arsenate/arsenite/antimonite-responsive transcriptional repressor